MNTNYLVAAPVPNHVAEPALAALDHLEVSDTLRWRRADSLHITFDKLRGLPWDRENSCPAMSEDEFVAVTRERWEARARTVEPFALAMRAPYLWRSNLCAGLIGGLTSWEAVNVNSPSPHATLADIRPGGFKKARSRVVNVAHSWLSRGWTVDHLCLYRSTDDGMEAIDTYPLGALVVSK